ncbi:DUF6588 family protein [Schleiferia thermophila]|uniref:Uncharacterized protein n=1 Tax=Schleiferia thermophila TaxID=884107 RepID=A0A369A204_9FLAO|nr:DUF6588 family protein [Schleiferia thermophila]RCX03215.1 hypothetical protein DES35_10396 [Schleiferia thermophila]
MRKFLAASAMGILTFLSKGQTIDNQQIADDFKFNFNNYLSNYLRPFSEGFGAAGGLGWQMPHKKKTKFSIHVTPVIGFSLLPDTYKSFDFNSMPKRELELANPSDNILPTMVGGTANNTLIYYLTYSDGTRIYDPLNNKYVTAEIDALSGVDLPVVGIPTVGTQVGVWLPFHTGIAIRYFPKLAFGEASIGQFGFSLQHDVAAWFHLPVEVIIGYNQQRLNFLYDRPIENHSDDNTFTFTSSSRGFDLTVAKYLGIIKPYIQISSFSLTNALKLEGDFEFNYDDLTGLPPSQTTQMNFVFSDPFDIQVNKSFVNYGGGLFINLGIFFIHGQYMLGEFQNASVSIGLKVGF